MKLAMEIPKPHLEELSKLTDVDFALAHLVLEDKEYAEFYAAQSKRKRRVILDNSMHELAGKPLTVPEILEAAIRISPSVVIPPDKIGDAQFTYDSFQQMRKHPKNRWDTALVIQGETFDERCRMFMDNRQYTYTLMLPYREPRTKWFSELLSAVPKHTPWPPYLHLLGMATFDDLEYFVNQTQILGWNPRTVCIDTAKPIKWGMLNTKLDTLENVHGGGLLNHSAVLTPEQMNVTLYNLSYLRRFMA